MKKALTSIEVVEDDNGISAAKTPKKMLRQEFEKKKMLVLNKAVGIVNEHKKASEPLSEEEHFGMIVAKTLARLSGKNKLLTKKKINDILFEAEFQQDQASGQFVLTEMSYNQQYRAGEEQYFTGYHNW